MPNASATVWEISLAPLRAELDFESRRLAAEIEGLRSHLAQTFNAHPPAVRNVRRGFLLEGPLSADQIRAVADEILVDPVIEAATIRPSLEPGLSRSHVTVMRKPGVMDPVSESVEEAIRVSGRPIERVRTFLRVEFEGRPREDVLLAVARKTFANDAVDQIVLGDLSDEHLAYGADYQFVRVVAPILGKSEAELEKLSREGGLHLSLEEMLAVQSYFEKLGRDPTDVELETIAQTWSEHCSHKTLRGPYEFNGELSRAGILKDTIMRATKELARDWCVSVFQDNAGVIRFNDEWNVCFKVETHNHPSAIEPYGGANTGVGGVLRDVLGAGMGGKPICNTDVFCVAPPDTGHDRLPPGTLHPARVLRGVVAGVRDYGNRMGVPTVNGAVFVDERYLANPLVYCGAVGLLPADKSFGAPQAGDWIVAIGGRTGRDGIHGATFSSGELTHESETISGGAVQIGNAVTEKKVLDVLLQARDRNLFHAVTDCGAGGFSSAVGEMGEEIGAHVRLEAAPLKYKGLTYTEIWISEAQERMVLAVPPDRWAAFRRLAESEGVEAVVLGEFAPTGRLTLTYEGAVVADLPMEFLHRGRPEVVRRATAATPTYAPHCIPANADCRPGVVLRKILSSWNVASKEWIVRQYDHEVQGGSVVKPLVGVSDDGPSDAAVVRPLLSSHQGLAIACGMNPRYGDLDPYRMATSAVDEAIRNVVSVGGDPDRTALLDNFCWGRTDRPEVLGTLCQAAFGCRDAALGYGAPFISGKDSLNNEYATQTERICIPPSLLISALAIVPDVRRCTTMDWKAPGDRLLLVGATRDELGGSHLNLAIGAEGGAPPSVDATVGVRIFRAVFRAIQEGWVRSCHDLSEGGLAVAAAESAFSGGFGGILELDAVPADAPLEALALLFSESNTRFLLEVEPSNVGRVLDVFQGLPAAVVGEVSANPVLRATAGGEEILCESIHELKSAWKRPFAW
jgi:phosphoribosylformylglycinamidine synthase